SKTSRSIARLTGNRKLVFFKRIRPSGEHLPLQRIICPLPCPFLYGFPRGSAASSDTTKRPLLPRRCEDYLGFSPPPLKFWKSGSKLVTRHGVIGKQTHDAHLVAAMQMHSVTCILTFSANYFARFSGITILDPARI